MEHGTGRKHLTKCKEARGNRAVRDFKRKVTKTDMVGRSAGVTRISASSNIRPVDKSSSHSNKMLGAVYLLGLKKQVVLRKCSSKFDCLIFLFVILSQH